MKTEQDIKILEGKISNARNRIAQAEKQYIRSLAKLERQKKAVEETRQNIERVKINITNQLCMLQQLREFVKNKVGV